jgi:hypothetical protein
MSAVNSAVATEKSAHIGIFYIGRRLDPFNVEPNFVDRIHQRADISCDIIEQVNSRHGGSPVPQAVRQGAVLQY